MSESAGTWLSSVMGPTRTNTPKEQNLSNNQKEVTKDQVLEVKSEEAAQTKAPTALVEKIKQVEKPGKGNAMNNDDAVYLSVWWPGVTVDTQGAAGAALPKGLASSGLDAVPARLRSAVAAAVLAETLVEQKDSRFTRRGLGVKVTPRPDGPDLPGAPWVMLLGVSLSEEPRPDLLASFTVHVGKDGKPTLYEFSEWLSLDEGDTLSAYYHGTEGPWRSKFVPRPVGR